MTINGTLLAVGSIVRSERLHGTPFGTVADMRNSPFHTGTVEVRIDIDNGRMRSQTWLPADQVTVATLDDVLAYYDERERNMAERINKLRDMVGTKVPKYNPEKHLGSMADHLSDAFRHEDGSITYVFHDPMPGDHDSPRTYAGNVATLIQTNTRCIDVDDDDAGLAEAYDRFTHALMRRYLAMFRPDIVHFDERWSAGDSYGWGYVTREKWEAAMGEGYDGDVTPEQAFDQEVRIYGLWANGDIDASAHIAERGGEVDMVFGHLGYDSPRDIARYHTDSPILEVLA